jgi:hypothetical protein
MERTSLPQRLQVPGTLEAQLREFRRKVWSTKMLEAAAIAVAGVLLAYLCVFALDRLWDTPSPVRTVVLAAAAATVAVVPYYVYQWIWRRRELEQLARLLSHKMPLLGDQLLGVIELAHSDAEQARSRALCHAAIQQVALDAEQRDLCEAAPTTRHRLWSGFALSLAAIGIALAVIVPAAASNAWVRLAMPWKDVPRYTFAALAPLPEEIVVAHGEPSALAAELMKDTAWRPQTAELEIDGRSTVSAALSGDQYQFELPPLIAPASARLKVGDASQTVRIEPKSRPELMALEADVQLPKYLGRKNGFKRDVRGGAVSLVKGSSASFAATASRPLVMAKVNGQLRKPVGARISTDPVRVDDSKDLELTWRDKFGLDAQAPFNIAITAADDEQPTLSCEDLPRRKVVLDSEQLTFKVAARDDFGIREVGMTWKGVAPKEMISDPAKGERVLGAGSAEQELVELKGAFSAKSLGIEPQPIEVHIFATDYFPGRERVYSPPFLLFVLSPEQHAIWITEQMSKWHRQSLEVRDREMRLYEENKALRALSAEELDQPQNRRRVENQAAAERANGRRLAGLTTAGKDLLRQAARNPEIGVGHLDKWAEMLEILDDISANRMPSVADLLKDASQAKSVASRMPAGSKKMAGQVRASGGAGKATEAPKGAKAPPAAPQIADMESSQQPAKPLDQSGEPQKKNHSAGSLRLPTTTLMGQAKKTPNAPPAEIVDQAVKEQKDLLAEFDKVANELNNVLANLEGSTLVKRLKAAARKQLRIAGTIGEHIEQAFGGDFGDSNQGELLSSENPEAADSYEAIKNLAAEEDESSYDVSLIMDDMEAYFERRRLVRFKSILDEMREEDVIGNLRRLGEEIPKEQGLSMSQCEFWSDTLDRWAEDLVDPACSGACPGCRSKGSLPPSIVLEILKILEGEINLREETRVAEQAKAATEAEKYEAEAERLSEVQDGLDERVKKVVERILELPDAEADFGKELQLLGRVSEVMCETVGILARPETGTVAIAAETEVIELLLQSRRINPNGGGGGGSSPGGGGGGDTKDTALALLGAGLNEKEVREDRGVTQAVGETGSTLPEEFRAGLDEYFSRLETERDGG